MLRFASLLAPLLVLAAAPTARAAIIPYEVVFTLVPGGSILDSAGGPTFDDSGFAPNGTVAPDDFSLEVDFQTAFYFDLSACAGLTGYVDGSGAAVTALEGICSESSYGSSYASIDFNSDNTAYIDLPVYALALNTTYELVPEPGAALLVALGGVLVGALRRKA